MDLINQHKDDDTPIFREFVKRTLDKHAKRIKERQDRAMATFSSSFWSNRTYISSEESLIMKHSPINRFVDMKIHLKDGVKKPKKHHEVHNRIIMGSYNGIMMDLTYGLTEQVKNDIKATFDNKVL